MELTGKVYTQAMTATLQTMMATIAQVGRSEGVEDGIPPNGVAPAEVVRAMARLRLLEGVPFSYLVPDAELIPVETIRFFYLDRNATDALVQGALSVGTVNAADRAQLAELYSVVCDETDQAERLVRMKDSDAPAVDAQGRPMGAGGPISGFVLRSRLVSGWPGMHVRAYSTDTLPDNRTIPDMDTSPNRVRLLRIERLAPALLFVLFDGVPAVVHLEEPRSGIQFGVRLDTITDPNKATAVVTVRDVKDPNKGPIQVGAKDKTIPVHFRQGAPGVVNVAKLYDDLRAFAPAHMQNPPPPPDKTNSAEFAMQMLRFPLRQVFGDTTVTNDFDAFAPTIKIAALTQSFALAAQVLRP